MINRRVVVTRAKAAAVACVVSLMTVTAVRADVGRTHQVTVEDYFTLGTITECAASPGGRYVAYAEMRWEPPVEKRNTDIWVVNAKNQQVQRLTFDPAADRSVRWSPDERFIYFASARQRPGEEKPPYHGKNQVWRVALDGGRPQPVTREDDGIGLYDLSADGHTLYYTKTKEHFDEEWKELRKEYEDLHYGHGITKFSELWALDLVNWRTRRVADENRVVRSLAVASDGKVAMITTPDEELIANEGWSRVDVFDPGSKAVATVTPDGWRDDHPSPYGWLDDVAWSDDARGLAFTVSFDGYPTRVYVAELTHGGKSQLRELKRPPGVSVMGGTTKWRANARRLCFIGEEKARARVYEVADVTGEGQGKWRTLTRADGVVTSFDSRYQTETIVVVEKTVEHPPDVFLYSNPDTPRRLTRVNEQVREWKLPEITIVRWKGADGDPVEGILELPLDPSGDKPLPMVVEIHGGPTAATAYALRFWIYGRTLLPAKGFAVFSPNYRGSTGYGDKFMTDLIGRENDIDVEDILLGVDAMVERGIADPNRLGVMGWSNGGFLTNCLIARTNRFKAASSGAGVLDMIIQWGTEDTPGHVINFMRGLPWSDAAAYRDGSPIYGLAGAGTPTLIHVGENDERVPPAHSRALYRALKYYLNVPTELVVYPDEGHGLTTYEHRKAKMEWDLAWFERYLKPDTASESQKPKTPLAQ